MARKKKAELVEATVEQSTESAVEKPKHQLPPTLLKPAEGNWFYRDMTDGTRRFAKVMFPFCKGWLECSDAEKIAWEEAHK